MASARIDRRRIFESESAFGGETSQTSANVEPESLRKIATPFITTVLIRSRIATFSGERFAAKQKPTLREKRELMGTGVCGLGNPTTPLTRLLGLRASVSFCVLTSCSETMHAGRRQRSTETTLRVFTAPSRHVLCPSPTPALHYSFFIHS